MLKILSTNSFVKKTNKNLKNNKNNPKKENVNKSSTILNKKTYFNPGNNNIIKSYKNYSYILDFIDATSKKKKSKNKNKNNNMISSEVKPNKILDINENIDNNNKEIKENNEDIINVNNNQNEDNNIININIMDKGKNSYNQTKEIEININSKTNQNDDNNIINNNEKNQDINNKFKIKKQNTTYMNIPKNSLDKNKSKEFDKERIKIYNNYSTYDTKKYKPKNKLKQMNSSLDEIYNNNTKYLNIKNLNRNSNLTLNKQRQMSAESHKNKINELTNKLTNILNLSTYNTLIKKCKIKKAGLETSISNLENSIKLFRKNKKRKDSKCRQLYNEITKIIANHSLIKEKTINFDSLKQKVDNENKEIQDIKEETNNINLLNKQTQKEINEMNVNIQILNKKIADEYKLCEKMRKDIKYYKNHTDNLIQKLKIKYQNSDIIEKAITNLEENS
mgnify:CR=1 FL=1